VSWPGSTTSRHYAHEVPTRLDEILAYHRGRAAKDDRSLAALMATAGKLTDPPSLLDALLRGRGERLRVIAEVKRRSPSAGNLSDALNPGALAAAYERGGAAAISVLTDGPHFGGDPADVSAVRSTSTLPVLRKDFTVSGLDVADARCMGASGVLLIVAALSRAELRGLMGLTDALGLTALVEVHDARELDLAVDLGAMVIGVNQRDLTTFEIDEDLAATLAVGFPSDVVAVAESGLRDAAGAQRCAALGYDAVLVGEAFVRAEDPAAMIEAFMSPVEAVA
jgi:indole-3-glycerol phosphate synthase